MLRLRDVQVKPPEAIDYAEPTWTKKDIENGIKWALNEMVTKGFYAPYVERCPVVFQEEFSKDIENSLEGGGSFACTDGEKVYFDTDRAVEHFKEMMKKKRTTENIAKEVGSVLSHEYTHILCEHRAIAEALIRKYGTRAPHGVAVCHTIACEIQANRGSWVCRDSLIYECGVTEEKHPETKGLRTYSEIFSALLKNYNDKKKKMDEEAQQIADMLKDALAEQLKNGKGADGKESNGKGKSKLPFSSKNGGSGGLHLKKTEEVEEEELTEEEIKRAIEEANNSEQEVYEELVEFGGGYGLDKIDGERLELNPDTALKTEFKRWDEQRIKNELKRLKGYVRGSFSREREKTYARPTRRAIDPSSKLIRKGIRNAKSLMPRVLVAMDSSGSMGGTPVTTVATAIGNLFKDLGRPTEGCYIVKHESKCSYPEPLSKWEEVVESFKPSGGNCFNNVVKLANELKVDVVFNIGDGCDCCIRRWQESNDPVCQEFKQAGRIWVDTLILDKKHNYYFDSEWNFDKEHGFEREIIQLGEKIGEYL